jgi:hypothetical protein
MTRRVFAHSNRDPDAHRIWGAKKTELAEGSRKNNG